MDEILTEKELRQKNKIRESKVDLVYYIIVGIILALLVLIVVYPIYYIMIASISDPDAVLNGEVWLYPVRLTVNGYGKLFQDVSIWRGYGNTILYTVLGTA